MPLKVRAARIGCDPIRAVVLMLGLGMPAAQAAPAVEQTIAALRARCGADVACLARGIASELPPGSVLQTVPPPDTDRIRWATTAASLGRVEQLDPEIRLIELRHFGRRVLHELPAALPAAGALWLDLRDNGGGDLNRMLAVAGWFTGPVAGALRLDQGGHRRALDIPTPRGAPFTGPLSVLVGSRTASSAEVLAALLRRHAGARILGQRTTGKTYTQRVWPLDHAWRVLVPSATIEVPGVDWQGGLVPDGPIEPASRVGASAEPSG